MKFLVTLLFFGGVFFQANAKTLDDYKNDCFLMKPMKDASMACEKAGDMYYKGIGADKSSFSAMIYYGKGCDNKSEYCCKMFKEINKK